MVKIPINNAAQRSVRVTGGSGTLHIGNMYWICNDLGDGLDDLHCRQCPYIVFYTVLFCVPSLYIVVITYTVDNNSSNKSIILNK